MAALWLVAPLAGHASAADELRRFVTGVKSAKGEFVQRQVRGGDSGSALKISGTSSGTFLFQRPGQFIWTYQKPYEQRLQADGKKLYIWDKDLNQVTIKTLGEALASNPASVLFGDTDLDKQFNVKDVGNDNKEGIDWVELTPKAKDSQFQRIGVGFKNNALFAMELRDAFGGATVLTFSQIEKNTPITEGQFTFELPKGADVISQ